MFTPPKKYKFMQKIQNVKATKKIQNVKATNNHMWNV